MLATSLKSRRESTNPATAASEHSSSKPKTDPTPWGKSRSAISRSAEPSIRGWCTQRTAGCVLRNSAMRAALSEWRRMRRSSVSRPWMIWEALNGESVRPRSCTNLARHRCRNGEPPRSFSHRLIPPQRARGSVNCGQRAASASQSKRPESITTPASDVPCPPKNLVAECTTMSAPCSKGRYRIGVARVESTITGIPRSWAMREIASRSASVASGLPMDSRKKPRVSSVIASDQAEGSAGST